MQVNHWPNTQAVARKLALEFLQVWSSSSDLCSYMCTAWIYFHEKKFWSELLTSVNAFKLLFHPAKITDVQQDATIVEEFVFFRTCSS